MALPSADDFQDQGDKPADDGSSDRQTDRDWRGQEMDHASRPEHRSTLVRVAGDCFLQIGVIAVGGGDSAEPTVAATRCAEILPHVGQACWRATDQLHGQ